MLVVLTVATSAVPHTHSLAPRPTTLTGVESSLTVADEGGARNHERPCSACARQEGLVLAPSLESAGAPATQTVLLPPAPLVAERSGQGPNVTLRGPPASTSSC